MKISIITATYNSSKTVTDTLKSVALQTYPNIEHIIIDGASKDNTLEIVKQFPHVAKVVSEPDKGIYDAMNKGIKLATGDVIGILNSDDFYANENIISKVVQYFDNFKTDALYGDLQYVDGIDTQKVVRYWKSGQYDKDNFYNGWMPPHPTFFVRKNVYEKYGLFNISLKSAADYELMLRLLLRYEISSCYLPEVLVKMRTGGQSNMSLKNRLKAHEEDKIAWKQNNLKPKFYTFAFKPLSKLVQFLPHFK